MPNDALLIPDPILDDRTEADRIAARIHRSIGGLTVDDAQLIIDFGEALRSMIADAGAVTAPLLPELSSARPAEAHTAMLTEIERAFTETIFRFNQIPNKVRVALLRLMGITLREAVGATTTLLFTKTDDYLNIDVTIPAGTEVATDDRKIVVTTDEELVIDSGDASASVNATAIAEGDIGRIPPNSLALTLLSIAGLASVANTTNLTGGANAETPDQGKIRAREEFDIGEHLGSTLDWENWIYFEVLRRKGRVTAFERYLSDFSASTLGYLLIVVQGADGLAPTQALLDSVSAVIAQRHIAGISVSVRGPDFKSFDISADVKIKAGQNATTLINKAKQNLASFFDPLRFPFGPAETDRSIGLSDIAGQIEAASPTSISVSTSGNGFAITLTIDDEEVQSDVPLNIGEIPMLGTVTLNVVS